MKSFCLAAALVLFAAGCTSTSPPAQAPVAGPDSARAHTSHAYILHTPENTAPGDAAATRPPRLTVGVSDPDTELILPWFLNDIINFVNYR